VAAEVTEELKDAFAEDGLCGGHDFLFPVRLYRVPHSQLGCSTSRNVSLADAQDYVSWLSEKTGQTWRIPYEDEVKSLYENREGENTLDYWAG
jgi:hypothetical protein